MQVKGLLTSKTVWGGLITLAAVGTQMAGIDIGDQAGWLNDVMALIGAGLAIYGRITAVKKIGGLI